MKGLLLKDWYMIKKYCKVYLFIAAVFIAVSFAGDDNLFFTFYPCLLCGMIPVNLLGYDERSRWVQYSAAMPYTKTQIVSGKYIIGLLTQFAMLSVTGVAQTVKMLITGGFYPGDFAVLMLMILIVSTLASAIPLPFVFKFGVEKGRIAYYAMIGFVCAASVTASGFLAGQHAIEMKPNPVLLLFAAAGIGIYILSWYLSIVFFKRREIQ